MGQPRRDVLREPNGRAQRYAIAQQRAEAARKTNQLILAEVAAKKFRLAYRTEMVGGFPNPSDPDEKCNPSDSRAGYPLGILYLRGKITECQYEAGLNYTRLHYSIFGASSTHSALAAITPPGGEVDAADLIQRVPLSDQRRDELMADNELRLAEATAALLSLPTLAPYRALCNLALYDQPARFMDLSRRRTAEASEADARDDAIELGAIVLALDTLVALGHRRHYGRR